MEEQTIHSDLIRGHIDAILLRILRDGDHYGYGLMKQVLTLSDGQYELKEPSLYTPLQRLEKQGSIESYWGDESRGGRRKYYRITPQGRAQYEEALAQWQWAKEIITKLLGGNDG